MPITQHWLIPEPRRPKLYTEHPTMALEEIRVGAQGAWDDFYSLPRVWSRATASVKSTKGRLAFVLISKLYRQMYANTGIATDSARVQRSAKTARLLGLAAKQLFRAKPMPGLKMPVPVPVSTFTTKQQQAS